ncbi:Flagellar basal body protein (modular protein) [uncultured Gammaproteobacteria bacterium]
MGNPTEITITVQYGTLGPQQIKLNLGKFGRGEGVTQFSDQTYSFSGMTQDGLPMGHFKGVSIDNDGNVVVDYDNGRSKNIYKVAVATFNNPNGLRRESGGVFINTLDSGAVTYNLPGTNAAGNVVGNALESSTVDIADQFTKLIITQRAYSANSKVVTTVDEMLKEGINLK